MVELICHILNLEAWGELLKLGVPYDKMQDCHVFFTFRNRKERSSGGNGTTSPNGGSSSAGIAEKPFAFAYLPLFARESTFVPDGTHPLVLYRYDSQAAVPSSYFEGPATARSAAVDLIPAALAKVLVPLKDSMTVRSFLCSTKLTQDPTLIKLINWERDLSNDPAGLKDTLVKLRYSPEFECIKMITHIFDSLFAILSSRLNEKGEVDELGFQAVVTLLGRFPPSYRCTSFAS